MTSEGAPSAAPKPQGFRSAASSGSIWATLQVVLSKGTAAVSTFAFAYLLDPAEIGVGAAGLAVVSLLLIFPPPVISDVLVRFGGELPDWIAAGRRLARVVATVSLALISVAAIAIAIVAEHERTLALIVALLSIRAFFESLSYPPLSRMRVALRFREIAAIDALTACTVMVAGIGYAWITRRPEAVVIGFVAGAVVRYAAFAAAAGAPDDNPSPRGDFTTLFADFRHACLGHYIYAIYLVIDRLMLTALCSDRVVGIYYFAFQLSTQINAALGLALGVVVQPIFGHLRNEPARQLRAFRAVSASITALAIPAMLLQAALARLFFEIALPADYAESAPVLEILSIAMCFSCCMGPCLAMLTAQSRFRAYLLMQIGQLAMLGTLVAAGAALGGEESGAKFTACAVLVQFVVFGPFALWLAGQRPDLAPAERLNWWTSIDLFLRPFLIGAVAFAPTVVAAHADLGLSRFPHAAVALAASVVSIGIYAGLLRAFAPATWHDLRTEALAIMGRLRRRGQGASPDHTTSPDQTTRQDQ